MVPLAFMRWVVLGFTRLVLKDRKRLQLMTHQLKWQPPLNTRSAPSDLLALQRLRTNSVKTAVLVHSVSKSILSDILD